MLLIPFIWIKPREGEYFLEEYMQKNFWIFTVVLAAIALLCTACPDGSGSKNNQTGKDNWPDFENAYKLEVTQFVSSTPGEGFVTEWGFKHPGGAEDADFGAPHNPKTFLSSKYLLIATVGGGKVGGTPNNPKTEFNPNGFEPIKFKVDAANLQANGSWDNSTWAENTFRLKPTDEPNWIVSFPHEIDEIIYFVYDLGNFIPRFSSINTTQSQIVFKIAWGPDEKSLGLYQAYITDANLSQGSAGVVIRNHAGDTTLADNVPLGWITRNPGLILAQ
jgi:hypothetical protein